MLATELFESPSICSVCGCTPCNCTHIVNESQLNEASYRDVIRLLLDKFYADMGISPEGGHWFGPLDVKEGIKDKVAAGLTAAALAASPVAADAAPSVAGVIASQTAARHAAAAREKSSDYATKQKPMTWSEILKAITSNVKSSR